MPVHGHPAGGGPHRKVNTVLLAASGSGGSSITLLLFILLIAAMYFLMIRPQQRRARQQREMQSSILPGQQIATIGGLVGTVDAIDDQFVYLEVAPGVVTKYRRGAIAQVLPDAPEVGDEGGASSTDGADGESTTHPDAPADRMIDQKD